jgi:hypothetical protein
MSQRRIAFAREPVDKIYPCEADLLSLTEVVSTLEKSASEAAPCECLVVGLTFPSFTNENPKSW